MPELPEVETIVKSLSQHLPGKMFRLVEVKKPLVVKENASDFSSFLQDKTIHSVVRHGKAIYFVLQNSPKNLRIHLGMTGQLLLKKPLFPAEKHARVLFQFENADFDLHYCDMRQFGRLEFVKGVRDKNWGPDAWVSSEEEILAALRRKSGMIKHALLNQNVVAGLGNIYVDESLFRSRIHPKKNLNSLSKPRLLDLYGSIRAVLKQSIDLGGTSFRNYVDTAGSRGGFKGRLNVYGKEGEPCPSCGAPIRKMVVASRGTHYCPKCQKR